MKIGVYKCSRCGKLCESFREEEEAKQEVAEKFGTMTVKLDGIELVCDECYEAALQALNN